MLDSSPPRRAHARAPRSLCAARAPLSPLRHRSLSRLTGGGRGIRSSEALWPRPHRHHGGSDVSAPLQDSVLHTASLTSRRLEAGRLPVLALWYFAFNREGVRREATQGTAQVRWIMGWDLKLGSPRKTRVSSLEGLKLDSGPVSDSLFRPLLTSWHVLACSSARTGLRVPAYIACCRSLGCEACWDS